MTFSGPPVDDFGILKALPPDLGSLLSQLNGFVQYGGGLHVRGACLEPEWHSLRSAWHGPNAFHLLYKDVEPHWIPFGEDCLGDQFFLVDGRVLYLVAETGEIEEKAASFKVFLEDSINDPVNYLAMQPLLRFQTETGALLPGQLLNVYPPFCTVESAEGVQIGAVPALEAHRFHADLAKQWPEDGQRIRIVFSPKD